MSNHMTGKRNYLSELQNRSFDRDNIIEGFAKVQIDMEAVMDRVSKLEDLLATKGQEGAVEREQAKRFGGVKQER